MRDDVRQLFDEGLGDSRFLGIEWVGPENLDVRLVISPPGDPDAVRLMLRDVTDVDLSMQFGNLAGPALTFQGTAALTVSGRIRVRFDFAGAPPGSFECECGDIEIEAG